MFITNGNFVGVAKNKRNANLCHLKNLRNTKSRRHEIKTHEIKATEKQGDRKTRRQKIKAVQTSSLVSCRLDFVF